MVRYYLKDIDEPLEYDPFAMDTEEINQDDEESEVAVFTRDTLIKDVRHTLVPIEYPATSDEGIAYVYHVENSKAAFHDVNFELIKLFYKEKKIIS
ncbi:hypothetical protein GLOIN_2v1768496 [Rhizophagus irregularis DAOM 181602=DAOM 197198]|uniref:Uncharacterized protein n=2 Tax=Rhizophagus irregularis TaxID=588596 RepID=A0A2P4QGN9_RHIID|nr:hypothetical protein GLOIN_2v1768496 [Rhizophagus irregularis DAOM 181602=DAOM 197198]POG76804.1 hypothetical protein GLOIN_2v1768496 [Rhizophagus irregularis DAOM 181602=DAOM 197198]GBC23064.2 hypothetical protein GLOIN_2v1768496 [Rhizophagus irregularis DAOM 181602=DAOM 197198]|eukprot:XP_025183670.1 hypothetical protein GLOIN_2v1768496 [Rhizophagus irregularis DAOM 181602=DAOM 197198]